ncbi:MAG TPA: hypothetical protein VFN67_17740 [Polyangiales bacterium]|nr:hypothetical protein [Polyangiales bacterium]
MRKPERSVPDVFNQTWNRKLDVIPAVSRAGPVSTARVRIIGTDTDTDTRATLPSFGKTQRYPSVLPSHDDCIPQPEAKYDERDWRLLSVKDVSFLADGNDALPFARTLPALTHEDLGIEESGVHEVGRLRLTLDPSDSTPDAQRHGEPLTPTLRLRPSSQLPLKRAWQRWEEQSPIITIGTAATFCLLSALLVGMLAP